MHRQQLHETEKYHYLNVVPNSRVESAHREILSLAIDLNCMIIKQLKETSVHQNIIDLVLGGCGMKLAFILFSPIP